MARKVAKKSAANPKIWLGRQRKLIIPQYNPQGMKYRPEGLSWNRETHELKTLTVQVLSVYDFWRDEPFGWLEIRLGGIKFRHAAIPDENWEERNWEPCRKLSEKGVSLAELSQFIDTKVRHSEDLFCGYDIFPRIFTTKVILKCLHVQDEESPIHAYAAKGKVYFYGENEPTPKSLKRISFKQATDLIKQHYGADIMTYGECIFANNSGRWNSAGEGDGWLTVGARSV